MSEDCGICGLLISDKFSHTLICNHTFHYECLMKSFQNSPAYKKQFNHCPYCRQKSDFLPLVNGLKKILPNVHCKNTTGSIQEKKLLLKSNYSKRCEFILTKGKNKGKSIFRKKISGFLLEIFVKPLNIFMIIILFIGIYPT